MLPLTFSDVAGAVRRHLRIVAVAGLVSLVVLGLFLFTRAETAEPTRWRTEVSFAIPSFHPDAAEVGPRVPRSLIRGQGQLAASETTREAALGAAGLEPDVSGIDFAVELNEFQTVMTLAVTTQDRDVSTIVADAYAEAALDARREVVIAENEAQRENIVESIDTLRARARAVENELTGLGANVPPVQQISDDEDDDAGGPQPLLGASTQVALLVFERDLLYREIASLQLDAARSAVDATAPNAHAERFGVRTQRIRPSSPSPLIPAAVILLGGLVLGLGGAVTADRLDHTIRNTRSAARVLDAPVLSMIPSGRRRKRYAVLQDPDSPRADAYRSLAATSVATDQLPKAIMVTAPRGDAHDDVAGNFAASLARLGLKVALLSTSPRQDWYLEPFDVGEHTPTLPDLLTQAHQGHLDGQLQSQLPSSASMPDLTIVPPGEGGTLEVPLDGLQPLLDALSRSDFDVTVIAGPALLEDPNATIVAWATGTVLWACQLGESVTDDATLAATRLELAGVHPFGVATLGAET